mmetsp:Transcript_47404/g.103202  ORF Transcript_47404/g.103202 Transcript_47404/m.103202 type:complete len:109 (-) Transcript_47404:360-686(-)
MPWAALAGACQPGAAAAEPASSPPPARWLVELGEQTWDSGDRQGHGRLSCAASAEGPGEAAGAAHSGEGEGPQVEPLGSVSFGVMVLLEVGPAGQAALETHSRTAPCS